MPLEISIGSSHLEKPQVRKRPFTHILRRVTLKNVELRIFAYFCVKLLLCHRAPRGTCDYGQNVGISY